MPKNPKPQSVTMVGGRNVAPAETKKPNTQTAKEPQPEPQKTPEPETPKEQGT